MKKAAIFAAIALVVWPPPAWSSDQAQMPRRPAETGKSVHPGQPIPKNFKTRNFKGINFKTWSLFLICNPMWLTPQNSKDLRNLYEQFHAFGRAIGNDHLAVWFTKDARIDRFDRSGPIHLEDLFPESVDVERSIQFCQAWNLVPSAGPHVVVTSTYPDESKLPSGLPKDSAVFELGNMGPKEISDLLAKLTDELIETGRVDNAFAPTVQTPLWVRLLEAAQRSINSFGCAWSFKIEAGAVSANLHSCQGH